MTEEQLASVLNILDAYGCSNNKQLKNMRARVLDGENVFCRKNFYGHFTASAVVVSSAQGLLAIKHRQLDLWLVPGGHIDGSELPVQAAIREAREETGIKLFDIQDVRVIDIDIHPIAENAKKGEAAHLHYDIRFLFQIDKTSALKAQEEEIKEAVFVPFEHLTDFWFAPSLQAVVETVAALKQ